MSTHGNTRLVCRLVRLRDAMTGSRANRHIAHCSACQAYYQSDDALVDQLRATAPRQGQTANDDLAQRIARSVRQTTSAPEPRRSLRPIGTVSAIVGSLAVFAFAFYLVRPHKTPSPVSSKHMTVVNADSVDMNALFADVDSLRARLLTKVKPSAEKLATDNPLTQEIASMQTDARSALGFLALNFLPTDSARKVESRIDPTRS